MRKDTTAYSVPSGDKADCSVRALMGATGMPYQLAQAIFAAHGRKFGKGTQKDVTAKVHAQLGLVKIPADGMTIEAFCVLFPKGRFVVHKSRHAFAVVDGIVHDWQSTTKDYTRIIAAWKVEKTFG